ncbi:MAG: DUF1456 family protein [Amphibacillus sp.]|nr:DUF1456 family protein [Amphibacillus sp.]
MERKRQNKKLHKTYYLLGYQSNKSLKQLAFHRRRLNSLKINKLNLIRRKEGHRNYKPCGDRYIRNFLKGLAIQYR